MLLHPINPKASRLSISDGSIRSKPATGRRFLAVVRAGDDSLHRNWIAGAGKRDFDLLVSYYGDTPEQFWKDADHYHVMGGARWPAHHAIVRANAALLDTYEHVCFACDDLDADAATWNALFHFCEDKNLDLAQPAILGPISYPITAPVEDCLYRLTTFVENMCPVFSKRALAVCGDSFAESVSGWGLNHLWPKLLMARGWKLAVIDDICVTHTRAMREGQLYKLLGDLGIDPETEKQSVLARYGIGKTDVRELSRIKRSSGKPTS